MTVRTGRAKTTSPHIIVGLPTPNEGNVTVLDEPRADRAVAPSWKPANGEVMAALPSRGRIQVSGDIGDLLTTHRLLTGPAELAPAPILTVPVVPSPQASGVTGVTNPHS